MREVLSAVKQRGKASPTARMLGEWALLDYLLTSGTLGTGDREAMLPIPADLPDPREVLAIKQQAEAAAQAWDFD